MWQKSNDSHQGGPAGAPHYAGGTAVLPAREVQHAWFELTRARPWQTLALVPFEDTHATLRLAHDLAQMAALDPRNRVLVLNATGTPGDAPAAAPPPPPGPGGQIFAGAQGGAVPAGNGKYFLLDCARQNMDDATVAMVEVPKQIEQLRAGSGPYTMILTATSSLLARPASVPTARAMDAVVLCPTLGHSSFADARRCLEMVGEENVIGSVALRPR